MIITLLNKCMKKKKALTPKQRDIQRKQTKNDFLRIKWQRQNGLNDETFSSLPLALVQAQRIATNILKTGGRYLGQNQADTLNNFLLALKSSGKITKLTEKHAYSVMNIGKEVNRKMFKAYKAIK